MSFWNKLFGSKSAQEPPAPDPFADMVPEKLKPGWLVDYDGRTWEVLARHFDDMGDGSRRDKWELRSDSDVFTLTREDVGGVVWTLTRKVPVGMVDPEIRSVIQQVGDPPSPIDHEGISYTMQSYGGAKFYRNGQAPPQPFLYWEYRDETGHEVLVIEQWGDIEFEARLGRTVEEYQFVNILPRQRH